VNLARPRSVEIMCSMPSEREENERRAMALKAVKCDTVARI
jgi:hypothetical protein